MTAETHAPASRIRPERIVTNDGERWFMSPSDLCTEGHTWGACTVLDGASERASWEMGQRGGVRWFVIDSEIDGPARWSFHVVDDDWKVRREAVATGPTFADAYAAVLACEANDRKLVELDKRLRRARSAASKARILGEIQSIRGSN